MNPSFKPGFEPGVTHSLQVVITEDMCPAFHGRIVHRVCSTWSMIQQMELAGRMLLLEYIHESDEGIGARVCVDHVSPAPVGTTLTVRATLKRVQANRVICDVTARVGDRLVGTGEHVQVVMNKNKLARLIERSIPRGQVGGAV